MIVMIAMFSPMKTSRDLIAPSTQIPNGEGPPTAALPVRLQQAKAHITQPIYVQYNEVNSCELRICLASDVFRSIFAQRA